VLIDEVQYAPGIFREIKRLIDQGAEPGTFWMTGSQLFSMMEGVQESLAGRVALFHLPPLSQQEIYEARSRVFEFDYDELLAAQKETPPANSLEIFKRILRGSMPALISGRYSDRERFYSGYIKTYLERDIKDMVGRLDSLKFFGFLRAAAARISQLLNYKSIADDAGIDQETAKNWLRLLEALGIIFFIRPYHNNILNRMVKTPKLYFYDSGLAANLTRWKTAETLMNGAMNGAFLENYCLSEILKGFHNAGQEPSLWFYRDKDQVEIDLLVESDGFLHPVEIKKNASPTPGMIASFKAVEKTSLKRGTGALICLAENLSAFDADNFIVPVRLL
jgi:predicted AAA+ superfamily ATPase